jgi:hypothetical protein
MIEPITAGIGIGITAIGMIGQSRAKKKYAKYSQMASQASIDAERLRERQMELEGLRRQREIIRQMQAAQSMSVATTAAAGAQYGSALPGALGQSRAQGNRQQNDVFQNLEIGRALFDANERKLQAEAMMAKHSGNASTFGGLASLGQGIFQSAEKVDRIGTTFGRQVGLI